MICKPSTWEAKEVGLTETWSGRIRIHSGTGAGGRVEAAGVNCETSRNQCHFYEEIRRRGHNRNGEATEYQLEQELLRG